MTPPTDKPRKFISLAQRRRERYRKGEGPMKPDVDKAARERYDGIEPEQYAKGHDVSGEPRDQSGEWTHGAGDNIGPAQNITKAEWEAAAIAPEQAQATLQHIRAGTPKSKNGGQKTVGLKTPALVHTEIPIDLFDQAYREYINESTKKSRVNEYAKQPVDTPIHAMPPNAWSTKKGNTSWHISDGGHRLMAAIARGDTTIPALVPVDSYDLLIEHANKHRERYACKDDQYAIRERYDRSQESIGRELLDRWEREAQPERYLSAHTPAGQQQRAAFGQAVGKWTEEQERLHPRGQGEKAGQFVKKGEGGGQPSTEQPAATGQQQPEPPEASNAKPLTIGGKAFQAFQRGKDWFFRTTAKAPWVKAKPKAAQALARKAAPSPQEAQYRDLHRQHQEQALGARSPRPATP